MLALRSLIATRPTAALGRISRRTASTHVIERELPKPPSNSRRPWYIGGAIGGAAIWAACLSMALNYQRKTSSVVNGTLFTVRYDPQVIELVGDQIDYADQWPWISGTVNHLKGKVDIAFDVTGSKGERARVHFASQRRGRQWHTVEFNVTRSSDQTSIDLGSKAVTDAGAPVLTN